MVRTNSSASSFSDSTFPARAVISSSLAEAHALKGMVGAFNASEAWASAKLLELTARAGRVDSLKEEADEFVRTMRALLISLENFAGIEHRDISWT